MNCPTCSKKMEAANVGRVRGATLAEYARTKQECKVIPHYHYRCDDCDSEYIWDHAEKGSRLIASPERYGVGT